MSFDVAAAAYARFMGVYSEPLAARFVELFELRPGQRALDVGCGPGALTVQLAERLGVSGVVAIDPSTPFVEAARERIPGVEVHEGSAEDLPFADGAYDLAVAQLVVHFMSDPVAGLGEMARVTRPGGMVAASVWDHAGERGPLTTFWSAVRDIDPEALDESGLPGVREGDLGQLFARAGLSDVRSGSLTVTVGFDSFDEWWAPYTMGVGPAGSYVAGLDDPGRESLERACRARLPRSAFEVDATAWTVTARA
ncbi:MAG TPA: class I SAM-dependent methyltransferase [Nocardioides sp.]|nr:class I SAM-dependent methyltransferase [Nocardioides sp.]